jgi:hypothetical protein
MVTTSWGTQAPSDFCQIIQQKAEGNPLFVEEITASLLERDVLVRDEGSTRWAADVTVEVPASVQDIIRARIDRLDEPVKRIVQTAAVIGRAFGFQLLSRIWGDGEVERYLDRSSTDPRRPSGAGAHLQNRMDGPPDPPQPSPPTAAGTIGRARRLAATGEMSRHHRLPSRPQRQAASGSTLCWRVLLGSTNAEARYHRRPSNWPEYAGIGQVRRESMQWSSWPASPPPRALPADLANLDTPDPGH